MEQRLSNDRPGQVLPLFLAGNKLLRPLMPFQPCPIVARRLLVSLTSQLERTIQLARAVVSLPRLSPLPPPRGPSPNLSLSLLYRSRNCAVARE